MYTSEMFALVMNRLYAYADDTTLLAVVRKPADRPAFAASLNRGMARIQVGQSLVHDTESLQN